MIRVKAALLLIEFKRSVEYCEGDIAHLMKKLPAGCEKVTYGARSLGIFIPPYDILPKTRAKIRYILDRFENYWLIGLSGEVVAMNGSLDPLANALRQYSLPPVRRRERS